MSDIVAMFEAIATAATQEAQRGKETATKQAEAEQLRADIAKMSAQVAKMSEALRMMSDRLAAIEAEANADSHADGTAPKEPQPEAEAQERPERGEGKPDALDMLRAAAEDVTRLTESNDHTATLPDWCASLDSLSRLLIYYGAAVCAAPASAGHHLSVPKKFVMLGMMQKPARK